MQSHSDLMQSLDSISNKIKQTSEQAERTLLEQQEKAFKTMSEKSATIYANAIKDQQTQAKQFALKAVKTSHKWAIVNMVLITLSVAMIALLVWGGWKLDQMKTESENYLNRLNSLQTRDCQTEVNGKMTGHWMCVQTSEVKTSLGKGWKAIAAKTE